MFSITLNTRREACNGVTWTFGTARACMGLFSALVQRRSAPSSKFPAAGGCPHNGGSAIPANMLERYLSRRLVNDGMEVLYGPPDIIPNRIQV